MSFTYAQLKQAIQDYTENTETSFVTNLPLFIRLSEERILKSAQLSLFRKNATASTTGSNKYFACPSDFLAPFSLSLAGADNDKFFLDFKDVSFLQTYTPDASTTGSPRYYAIFDVNNFILAPTPNTTFTGVAFIISSLFATATTLFAVNSIAFSVTEETVPSAVSKS